MMDLKVLVLVEVRMYLYLMTMLVVGCYLVGCDRTPGEKISPTTQAVPKVSTEIAPIVNDPLQEFRKYFQSFSGRLRTRAVAEEDVFFRRHDWEFKYDVRKTDSLVKPYVAVVTFVDDTTFADKDLYVSREFTLNFSYVDSAWKYDNFLVSDEALCRVVAGQPQSKTMVKIDKLDMNHFGKAFQDAARSD